MSYDNNPYYDPSKFGLELVDSIEWDGESYEFNMTAVWKAKRGEYYLADDSGCSCPAPFENIEKLEELDGPHNKAGLESALRYRVKENSADESDDSYYRSGRPRADLEKEVCDLLARLK